MTIDESNRQINGIINSSSSRIHIIAGPGTGKTSTLESRVTRLLLNGQDPKKILAISFTRSSARDVQFHPAEKGDFLPTGIEFYSILNRQPLVCIYVEYQRKIFDLGGELNLEGYEENHHIWYYSLAPMFIHIRIQYDNLKRCAKYGSIIMVDVSR
jgi:hypothetical protein